KKPPVIHFNSEQREAFELDGFDSTLTEYPRLPLLISSPENADSASLSYHQTDAVFTFLFCKYQAGSPPSAF
ncbi:hypothetical protein, partial [Faecalibaculum rodentium]|uniref:hypothetical protein n=1 Tax=Faecalibaculum rodentium TaxID=1702221 RepID=UPI0023F47DB4